MNSETKNCQNCKQDFTIEPQDFDFYDRIKVPPPTWCPECRMIRRFNFRNERYLFRRKDAHSDKEIFSGFSSEAKVSTYENNFWYGDAWDPFSTGLDYDFNTNFFDQFRGLLSRAPLPAKSVYNMVNSDYCNEASETKNSYLCFNTDFVENSAYTVKVAYIKDSFDIYESNEDELCYDSAMIDKCYRTFFSIDCESCVDVWFSKALRGCTNCFGCVNLTKKSYYFFNEPCTKDEYEQKIKTYNLSSYKEISLLKEKVQEFWLKFPVKYNHTLRSINSSGDLVFDSKNVTNSYSVIGGENLCYCQMLLAKSSNSYDYTVWGAGAENMYESVTCGLGCYNVKFSFNCWENARDLDYCIYSMGSSNCFGCVGLYKKEYCIFNKQYTKEEYFVLKEKIIEHMNSNPYKDDYGRVYGYGEFFPFDLSPVAYNESLAQGFFPINKEEAKVRGYQWREPNIREYQTTTDALDLPDDIAEVNQGITQEVIRCVSCSKAYRIIPMELDFYKKVGLPLPRMCHDCRFTERFKFVNKPALYERNCSKCSVPILTSYRLDRPEIVYCEKCYQQEVS